jgi:hypothetical protein
MPRLGRDGRVELDRWEPRCSRPARLVRPLPLDNGSGYGVTPGKARGPGFRRTSPGRYVPIDVDDSVVEQRVLEQACRLRCTGAVTGWASLRWQGAAFFTGLDIEGKLRPVPLLLGPALVRGDERVAVTQEQIYPEEMLARGRIMCARADRALFDEVRSVSRWSLREAVVAADMTSAAGLLTSDEFRDYVAARRSWTGVPRAREVAALTCDRSRSPQETRMRLVWVLDAGLPVPMLNCPLYDLDGRAAGRPGPVRPGGRCRRRVRRW